jgi:hypothetical protein
LLERQRLVCGRVVRGARELRRRLRIDDRSGLGGRGLVGGSWQVGVRVAKWSQGNGLVNTDEPLGWLLVG